MTRVEYMTAFANQLKDLPLAERRAALDFYNNYFDEGEEAGRSDSDIIAGLDPPYQAARRVKMDCSFETARKQPSARNTGRVLAAIFGALSLPVTLPAAIAVFTVGIIFTCILLVAAVAVLAVAATCCATVIALGVQAAALLFSGGASLLEGILLTGLMLMALGLAILVCLGCFILMRALCRGISRLAGRIYKWVLGKKKGD